MSGTKRGEPITVPNWEEVMPKSNFIVMPEGYSTVKQVALQIGVTPEVARKRLARLVTEGKVEKIIALNERNQMCHFYKIL